MKIQKDEKSDQERYHSIWRWRFALFPVQVATETWVWMEWYEVRGGVRYLVSIEYRSRGVTHRFTYNIWDY